VRGAALSDRLLVDECLSVGLVAVAKGRGFPADHVTYLGKSGWQDRNLAAFALENSYIVVTNNRRHFLKEYTKLDIHGGLIVIVPAVKRIEQQRLFDKVLDILADRKHDLVNHLAEVVADGTIHVRDGASAFTT
jgi:predicted nuclease of predicted toxin-antitoxin system